MFKNVIVEKFRKQFNFLPVFALIMCFMKAPKNFVKVAILKIWELVSLEGVKTHFGKLALNPNIYSGFKPEIHFIFQFQFWNHFSAIADFYFVFLQGAAVKPRVLNYFHSNLELGFSIPRFYLTQTDFENPKKIPFQTRKGLLYQGQWLDCQ